MDRYAEFRLYLRSRRDKGESYQSIGFDFGVSRQAVQQWIDGVNNPSGMALKIAESLQQRQSV